MPQVCRGGSKTHIMNSVDLLKRGLTPSKIIEDKKKRKKTFYDIDFQPRIFSFQISLNFFG